MKIQRKTLGDTIYNFISLDQATEFVCDRCLQSKKAKKRFEYNDKTGNKRILCNGCFGYITATVNKKPWIKPK